jgi:hypothetical protein
MQGDYVFFFQREASYCVQRFDTAFYSPLHATVHINWRRTSIGAGIYVEYRRSAPTDLFNTTYVEPVVEKEARSIQNDPRY